MHLTTSPVDWYVARAGGIVAYVLLSVVVLLGITMAGRKKLERWPRFALEDIHRAGGLLVGAFITLHVVTIAIDSYLPFSIMTIIVPFTARYRPVWVGLGVVAAELLIALAVANHYRGTKLSQQTWRKLHYANFAVWTAATFHGLGTGTDRSTYWMLAIYGVSTVAVVAGIVWRILSRIEEPATGMMVVAGVATAAVILILAFGPLEFKPRPWNATSFNDNLTGQILRNSGPTRALVSLAGKGKGEQDVIVRADLLVGTQNLVATSFQMEYLPSGMLCKGKVTAVHDLGFEARCSPPYGPDRAITAAWDQSTTPDIQAGTLSSSPVQ